MSNLVWVAVPVPSASFARGDIAFCPIEGKLVFAGRDAGVGYAYKSTDGIVWTELVVPVASEFKGVKGIDLTVNRGRIVLVSVNRVYEKDIDDVWTEINPTNFVDCTALGYLSGIGFCTLNSYLGSPDIFLSNDGYTWEQTSSQPVLGTKIRSGGGRLLRFGTAGVSLSLDGYSWSSSFPGVGFGSSFRDVTYHNLAFTWFSVIGASGASPTRIFKSVDVTGEEWNIGTPVYSFGDTGATSILPGALIYDPFSDKLILSGYYNIYTSDDLGVTWIKQSKPAAIGTVDKACLGPGIGGATVYLASDDHIFLGISPSNIDSLFTGDAAVDPPTDLTVTENLDDVTLDWTDNEAYTLDLLGDIIDLKISDGTNTVDFFPISTSNITSGTTPSANSNIIPLSIVGGGGGSGDSIGLLEYYIQYYVNGYYLDVVTQYTLTFRVRTFMGGATSATKGISTPSTSSSPLVFTFTPISPILYDINFTGGSGGIVNTNDPTRNDGSSGAWTDWETWDGDSENWGEWGGSGNDGISGGSGSGSGGGGIDLGGAATIVFSINPSGIYTITPGKLHDTLYERLGETTTINVKIPDPFIKTAFLGDE